MNRLNIRNQILKFKLNNKNINKIKFSNKVRIKIKIRATLFNMIIMLVIKVINQTYKMTQFL